jgi:hypothetical protein
LRWQGLPFCLSRFHGLAATSENCVRRLGLQTNFRKTMRLQEKSHGQSIALLVYFLLNLFAFRGHWLAGKCCIGGGLPAVFILELHAIPAA